MICLRASPLWLTAIAKRGKNGHMLEPTAQRSVNSPHRYGRQFSLRFVFAFVTAVALECGLLRWLGPRSVWDAIWISLAAFTLILQVAAVGTIICQRHAAWPAALIGAIVGANLPVGLTFAEAVDWQWKWYWMAFFASWGAWYIAGFFVALRAQTRFLRCALLLAAAWTLLLMAISVALMWIELGTMRWAA